MDASQFQTFSEIFEKSLNLFSKDTSNDFYKKIWASKNSDTQLSSISQKQILNVNSCVEKFENIQTIHEQPNILETGGGLKNALPILGSNPVVTLNSDIIWIGSNPVGSLLKSWDPKKMDALLMLIPIQNTKEYCGQGDFYLDSDNLLTRRGNKPNAPYVYTGAQIIKTELLSNINEKSFSINLLWNKILNKKKAFGIVYDGSWIDVGHPKGIDTATKELLNNRNV